MSRQGGYQGYGAVQEYRDDPSYREYQDSPVQSYEQQFSQIADNISKINNGGNTIEKLAKVIGTDRDNGQAGSRVESDPTSPPDACRVHGTIEVSKVAGNFHITAGKYFPQLQLGLGHVHLESFLSDTDYNFTHRIDHFSFGEKSGGIINPLDSEEQVTIQNYHMFQYFMKIVPTEVKTYSNNVNTYQFSVTERNRSINHHSGSHGVPGIFVKYDVFPFKIVVKEEHRPYSQFLVRLCGIVGGIFVVSGLLHDSVGTIFDILCCRYKLGKYSQDKSTSDLLLNGSMENNSDGNSPHSQSYDPVDLLDNPSQPPGISLAPNVAGPDNYYSDNR